MKKKVLVCIAITCILLTLILFIVDYNHVLRVDEPPYFAGGIALSVYSAILLCEIIFWVSILWFFLKTKKSSAGIIFHSFYLLGALFFLVYFIATEYTWGAVRNFFTDLFPKDGDLICFAVFLSLCLIGAIISAVVYSCSGNKPSQGQSKQN